jgi:hypothetical protein
MDSGGRNSAIRELRHCDVAVTRTDQSTGNSREASATADANQIQSFIDFGLVSGRDDVARLISQTDAIGALTTRKADPKT